MKPKAPKWLTESFRDGVDERELVVWEMDEPPRCWLAAFDPAGKPCEGKLERFHFVRRQTVEGVLGNLLPTLRPINFEEAEIVFAPQLEPAVGMDIVHVAAWDPRNGGIACEAHHRRADSHLVPLPSEQLVVPYEALPEHVLEFASDYGLEEQLEAKYERQGPSEAQRDQWEADVWNWR